MAAEVPVSDVLCEAMEYLSKLGANLRTRSESLKEKRISKNKLRNAHAVHKAARKVLLICELSKKSLENVETGVRKVLSIVDASQAQSDSGGKTIAKEKQEGDKKFYHFEFESYKLRISKKIPIKHYMSVKVFAKGIPASMQEKYPVFYDCELKRRRRRLAEKQQSEDQFERSLKRKNSSCHSDTDEKTEKSKENQKKKAIESDSSESEKPKESRKRSGVIDKTKLNKGKSLIVTSNSDAEDSNCSDKINNRGTTDSLVNQDDISQCEEGNNEQNNMNLVDSKNKNEHEKSKMKDDFGVSDLIESLNEAEVENSLSKKECNIKKSQHSDDLKTNFEKPKRIEKEATNIRRKFSKIRIVDESSESDEDSLKNKREKNTQKEIQSSSGKENDFSEPKSKKIKLTDINDDESKEGSDHDSVESKKSEKELDDDSKPLIRCVNITKLLKPDILEAKIIKSPNDEQIKNNKNSKNENKTSINHNKEQRKLSEDERVRKRNKNAMNNNSNDEEFWAQKRNEVKQFKPKQFTVNIERLPKLSLKFLLVHNLKKIIQGAKTVCEVTKEKDSELEKLDKNIDEVKNALLNDSASEDTEIAVTTEARMVKESLLNDSDSDKEQTSHNNNNQSNQENVTESTAKNALLNESDSENNEQAHDDGTFPNDSPIELEQDVTEKIKNALLNDSDSDKNQNKEDTNEIMPSLQETTNYDKCDGSNNSGDISHNNKEDNVCNIQPNTIEPKELTQDTEKIKSCLLNDSSDSKSESSVIENKKTKIKMSKHKQKHAIKRMQAKKMLLNNSSSSDSEKEHSQDSDKDSMKHTHKRGKRISRISSSSSNQEDVSKHEKKDSRDSTPQEKRETEDEHSVNEDKDSRSIDQVDGTIDEHSDSSVSKMVRSKAKPSGSSGQNSDSQDASDKDIDGLTNLNNLNKTHRRRDSSSTNNTRSRSSAKNSSRSKPTPAIGEDLLHAVSSSDASEDENMVEEDLPPVKLPGLNGDSIGHLAKDDLLGDSDSSVSHKEQSEAEETQNLEDSEEEENVKARRRKANAISSDSDGGTSRRKKIDKDARMSDFEDSGGDSSDSTKRPKRKKKGSESDASGTSSNEGGTKKRRRIKQLRDSDDASGSDTENEGRNKHGRKNIRKVMGKNQLEEATKKAARQEKERIARITERQKLYNNLEFDESGKPDEVVLEKVVLDFDPETKEPLIEVDRGLVKKLKPHQANGIKFMWDACFESVKRIKKDKGSGCILAHCMGLGKTLQVISLTHTLLIHGTLTGVNRVLVVCPLSTVLNWVNEFRMWLKHAHSEFEVDVYELSRYKQNSERAFQLQQWFETGGVCVLGYEMFRNLSADNNKKFKKKMLRSFQESLVDPGPDLVVCDEGHLLKNEKTSLSQSMNRVKSLRRIVLTGTPLQNNLKEYYCMVQFVKPNLLGKYNEYLNRFVNPITNGQYTDSTEYDIKVMKRRSHVLHKMLDGAVQRRDYGVLAPFLPPKLEFVLFITLSDVQVKLYQFYLDNYSRRPLPGKSSGFLFPDFQSLQRIWTHPLVLKYNSERYEVMQQKKREREEEDSEGSLVDFIDDDSTAEESSTEESSDDLSDVSDDSRKKSKKKKAAKKSKAKEAKAGARRGTRANPVELDDDVPEVTEVVEARNENPTEWWIKLVEDEELDDMRNSHKLVLLFDILRQCETIGDKLLVFSQSLYSLDLIEHFLGKVDEATQEGRIDEKLGRHVGSWSPGVDYFRLDGSTSCENRSIWCKNFNREDNPRARLFLISTRAGGLGINLVAANRVVIFDVSWNPSHDVQSIFRVYRFGQKKPCYVYRFLAMGTMEEKIYERQVTKQAISKRVIDEQQIDRHYAENDLAELYKFEARPDEPRPLPALPKDRLFAEMLREHEAQIYKYHEHDSLLENKEEETLSEEERKAAWEDFENEKNKPPPAPFQAPWPMPNGMVPGLFVQQQQQYAYAALAAMLRKDMPNINDNQIRDMLPLIYNSNPGLMQKMSEIYKYAQPGMMNPGLMNPVMNPAAVAAGAGGAGGLGGSSGLQYEPPWQRQQQQQQQMRLQQLMQHNQQMGAKLYAGGLGSRDPVAMAMQQQRAREIMMGGGAGRPRGRPPLAPRAPPAASQDVVNLDSD